MGVMAGVQEQLVAKFQAIFPHLDERQRRLLMGAEARVLGHGGIRAVAGAAGVREATVALGVDELDAGAVPLGQRVGPAGARKRVVDLDPGLRPALMAMVEPDERGDPMSPLRWTTKSTRNLAGELTGQGHRVSADVVADLLREDGFSLQSNTKTLEGKQHPDRDGQFTYLNEQARTHRDAGQPGISVDTKKKELLGDFKNPGRQCFHGDWNYTLHPATPDNEAPTSTPAEPPESLSHPTFTGMTPDEPTALTAALEAIVDGRREATRKRPTNKPSKPPATTESGPTPHDPGAHPHSVSPTGSWPPSCTCGCLCLPTRWHTCHTATDPQSAGSSARHDNSSINTTPSSHRRRTHPTH